VSEGRGRQWWPAAVRVGAVLLLFRIGTAAAQDVLIVRGAYVYLVPVVAVRRMVEMAPRAAWRHYPEFTRRIDVDGDGRADYIAIALGARGGYGAQVRYRLRYLPGAEQPVLGHWYWVAITDPLGKLSFERFSP